MNKWIHAVTSLVLSCIVSLGTYVLMIFLGYLTDPTCEYFLGPVEENCGFFEYALDFKTSFFGMFVVPILFFIYWPICSRLLILFFKKGGEKISKSKIMHEFFIALSPTILAFLVTGIFLFVSSYLVDELGWNDSIQTFAWLTLPVSYITFHALAKKKAS